MARFLRRAKLEGSSFLFVPTLAIDWAIQSFTKEEFVKDRERFTPQIKGDFPKFFVHFPTMGEKFVAFGKAGAILEEDESVSYANREGFSPKISDLLAITDQCYQLAILCFDVIEVDGHPAKLHGNSRISRTKTLHQDFLDDSKDCYIPEEALIELGAFLLAGSQVGEAEKKQSGQSPTGEKPEKNTATQTNANPAMESDRAEKIQGLKDFMDATETPKTPRSSGQG